MKRIKVWIAMLSLLLVLTTTVLPTSALANQTVPPQGPAQPAPPPPPPPTLLELMIRAVLEAMKAI